MTKNNEQIAEFNNVPDKIILQNENNPSENSYERLCVLGRGAFAMCYVVRHELERKMYACKVTSKTSLLRRKNKASLAQEIAIHRTLDHINVVKFKQYFEDTNYVYILLDLCESGSLADMLKRNIKFKLCEIITIMHHVLKGLEYLHQNNIVHRDIKLANLLVDQSMCVKIADFGLSTKLHSKFEKRMTICGTPNFIAPEILSKRGHSFGVDIWAFGCVMYYLIAGRAPFEGNNVKETFCRIKRGNYVQLCDVIGENQDAHDAVSIVESCLQRNPVVRPKASQLLALPLFKDNLNKNTSVLDAAGVLKELLQQLELFKGSCLDEERALDLHTQVVWICSWFNYTEYYGFAYRLSNGVTGVLFNDATTLIERSDADLIYVDSNGVEHKHVLPNIEADIRKKYKLFYSFKTYIVHLENAGGDDGFKQPPCYKTPILEDAMVCDTNMMMKLSNGCVQVNFSDHVKILVNPVCSTVTVLSKSSHATYNMDKLARYGCEEHLKSKLCYIYNKLTAKANKN